MSTARRKTSDAAATPPKPAVERSPTTRSTVPRKAKATVAGDAAELTKAAATKRRTSSKAAGSKVAQTGPVEPAAERADMIIDRETMIRERAYLRYLERGGGSGEALADWLTAEQEVDAELPQRGEPA